CKGVVRVTVKELKTMLNNIGLYVDVEIKKRSEVNPFDTEIYKSDTVLEGNSCNIKNWPIFKVWINKSNKVTIKTRGVQKSFDIQNKDELKRELKGFEII